MGVGWGRGLGRGCAGQGRPGDSCLDGLFSESWQSVTVLRVQAGASSLGQAEVYLGKVYLFIQERFIFVVSSSTKEEERVQLTLYT